MFVLKNGCHCHFYLYSCNEGLLPDDCDYVCGFRHPEFFPVVVRTTCRCVINDLVDLIDFLADYVKVVGGVFHLEQVNAYLFYFALTFIVNLDVIRYFL